jgi:putative transposase
MRSFGRCQEAPQLGSGRCFRVLTIMDDYTRQWLATIVDTSISGTGVVRALEELARTYPLPKAIVSDNGTEFTGGAFLSRAEKRGIELRFIQPGMPNQNAFVESFNGKLRLECLNAHWFSTLDDARHTIEDWRLDYNDVRPHSSLDETPPTVFAAAHGGQPRNLHISTQSTARRLLRFSTGAFTLRVAHLSGAGHRRARRALATQKEASA